MQRAIGAAIPFITILVAMSLSGSLASFVDLPSLLFIVGIVFGGLWWSHGPYFALRVFFPIGSKALKRNPAIHQDYVGALVRAKQLAYGAGIVGLLIGFISMMAQLDDPSQMGPGLAVALLCPFYSTILAWFVFGGFLASVRSESTHDETITS